MKVMVPDMESQFRVVACGNCGCAGVGYQQEESKEHRWRVKCPGCGQSTPWFKAKHDAQMDWNGRFGIRTHGWSTVYGRVGTGVPEEAGNGEQKQR